MPTRARTHELANAGVAELSKIITVFTVELDRRKQEDAALRVLLHLAMEIYDIHLKAKLLPVTAVVRSSIISPKQFQI